MSPPGTDGAVAVVNPATGELLERLDEQPAETLAEALDLVLEREAEAQRWRDALEVELRRRLKMRQTKLAVFGDWEVGVGGGRESEWDADELEPTLQRLVDEGTVRAGDIADVITRPPVVSRSRAKALAARLDGDAKAAVQAACTWKDKPGKLTVVRSVQLAPAPPPPAPLPEPLPDLNPEELFA